jgi:hypothetical protein
MYTTVRQYTGINDQAFTALLDRRAEVEAVLQQTPGFAQYDLIRTEGGMTSVTVCADQAGVDDANQRAAAWITANMPTLAPTPPQIATGESVIHLTANGSPTAWGPTTKDDYDALVGCAVFSSDNEQVGTVAGVFHPQATTPATVGGHYFAVKPGMLKSLFGADEVYIPETAIRTFANGKVTLGIAKAALEGVNWTTKPAGWNAVRPS